MENVDINNLKEIRMCSFTLNNLIDMYNIAIEDFKNKEVKNFDHEDILNLIVEFIRLKNDYEAIIKFVNGTNLKDTMTQFLIEQSKENE